MLNILHIYGIKDIGVEMDLIGNLSYIAGFFDGDGCITISAYQKGKHRKIKCVQLSFANNDKDLLEYIKNYFIENNCKGYISTKKYKKYKNSYTLKYAYRNALKVAKMILPYVRHIKKRERIILILNDYDKFTNRNGKYTDEEWIQREIFFAKVLSIK